MSIDILGTLREQLPHIHDQHDLARAIEQLEAWVKQYLEAATANQPRYIPQKPNKETKLGDISGTTGVIAGDHNFQLITINLNVIVNDPATDETTRMTVADIREWLEMAHSRATRGEPKQQPPQKIFISYAWGENHRYLPFADDLFRVLQHKGFNVWMDRKRAANRGLAFWDEIFREIETADRIIAIITPEALSSPAVQREWDYAQQHCKTFVPVLLEGDFADLPEQFRQLWVIDFRDARIEDATVEKLVRSLRRPDAPRAEPFHVPPLPPHFLPRPEDIAEVKKKVLRHLRAEAAPTTSTVPITVIRGLPGVGKSVLAAAVARSCEVSFAFPDGILWIKVGQEPRTELEVLLEILNKALEQLKERAVVTTENAAVTELRRALAGKRCLIVLDDVWELLYVEPFQQALADSNGSLLLTSRSSLATAPGGEEVCLDVLNDTQALKLLAESAGTTYGLIDSAISELPQSAKDVAAKCGGLPLALAICGTMKRSGISWESILQALREADLEYLAPENGLPNYEYSSVFKALAASVTSLTTEHSQLYREFAVFPKGAVIPEKTIYTYWQRNGEMERRHAEKILIQLANRSLLRLEGVAPYRTVSLHDLQHDYLHLTCGEHADLHNELLAAYNDKEVSWADIVDDGYLYNHLIHHLKAAKRYSDIHRLFVSPEWAQARGIPVALISDFEQARQLVADDDLATKLRYVLFADVVRQRYLTFPVEVLPVALEKGWVDANTVMLAVENMSGDSEAKLQAYLQVAPRFSAAQQRAYSERVVSIANSMMYEKERARDQLRPVRDLMPLVDERYVPELRKKYCELCAHHKTLPLDELNWLLPSMDDGEIDEFLASLSFEKQIALLEALEKTTDFPTERVWQQLFDSASQRGDVYQLAVILNRGRSHTYSQASSKIVQAMLNTKRWIGLEWLNDLQVVLPLVNSEDLLELWTEGLSRLGTPDPGSPPDRDWWLEQTLVRIGLHASSDQAYQIEAALSNTGIESPILETISAFFIACADADNATIVSLWRTLLPQLMGHHKDMLPVMLSKVPVTAAGSIWTMAWSLLLDDDTWRNPHEGHTRTLRSLIPRLPIEMLEEALAQVLQGRQHVTLRQGEPRPGWRELFDELYSRCCAQPGFDQRAFWWSVMTSLLFNYESSSRFVFDAANVAQAMPPTESEAFLRSLLDLIRSEESIRDRAHCLAVLANYLPAQQQADAWLEAPNYFAELDYEVNTNDDIRCTLLTCLPSVYSTLEANDELVQFNTVDLTLLIPMHTRWLPHEVELGIMTLVELREGQIADDVVKGLLDTNHNYPPKLVLTLYSHVSEEYEEQLWNDCLLDHTCVSFLEKHPEIVASWPSDKVWRAWLFLQDSYPLVGPLSIWDAFENYIQYQSIFVWTTTLACYIPDQYLLEAWQHFVSIVPWSDSDWYDAGIELAKRLPSDYIPTAWNPGPGLDPSSLIYEHVRAAMAPNAPDEFLLELAHDAAQGTPIIEDLFTCSMRKYIGHVYANVPRALRFAYLITLPFLRLVMRLYFSSDGEARLPLALIFTLLEGRRFGSFAPADLLLDSHLVYYSSLSTRMAIERLGDVEDTADLMDKRQLLQKAGGRKLREAINTAYLDAYTWWRDAVMTF